MRRNMPDRAAITTLSANIGALKPPAYHERPGLQSPGPFVVAIAFESTTYCVHSDLSLKLTLGHSAALGAYSALHVIQPSCAIAMRGLWSGLKFSNLFC